MFILQRAPQKSVRCVMVNLYSHHGYEIVQKLLRIIVIKLILNLSDVFFSIKELCELFAIPCQNLQVYHLLMKQLAKNFTVVN